MGRGAGTARGGTGDPVDQGGAWLLHRCLCCVAACRPSCVHHRPKFPSLFSFLSNILLASRTRRCSKPRYTPVSLPFTKFIRHFGIVRRRIAEERGPRACGTCSGAGRLNERTKKAAVLPPFFGSEGSGLGNSKSLW